MSMPTPSPGPHIPGTNCGLGGVRWLSDVRELGDIIWLSDVRGLGDVRGLVDVRGLSDVTVLSIVIGRCSGAKEVTGACMVAPCALSDGCCLIGFGFGWGLERGELELDMPR